MTTDKGFDFGETKYNPLNDNNIVNDDKFHENVKFVLNAIAESVGKTLGPGGGYTIISNIDNNAPVYPTKDGYTVIMEYKFNDQVKYFIAEIIKDISKRMNMNVGDGTTSGLMIARYLYNALMEYDIVKKYPEIGCKLPAPSIRLILDAIRAVLVEKISKDSRCVSKNLTREEENEFIKQVAVASANNNAEIGLAVAELFITRKSDNLFVTAETTFEDEDEVERNVGFEFGAGFIAPCFANQPDKVTCKMEQPKFLLVDGALTVNDKDELGRIIDHVNNEMQKPLVIVAKEFDQPVLHDLMRRRTRYVDNYTKSIHEAEDIVALTVSTTHETSRDRLEDLRIILGGTVLSTQKGKILNFKNNVSLLEEMLGSADEFNGNQLRTRVKNGHGDKKAVEARIKSLEETIKTLDNVNAADSTGILSVVNVDKVRRRIAMLNSDMTVIKVGGANEKERKTKKLIYDDAIMACFAAIKHGFTIGGNVTVPWSISNATKEITSEVVKRLKDCGQHVIVGNKESDVSKIVQDILLLVSDAFKEGYKRVVANMVGADTPAYKTILDKVYGSEVPLVYNLVSGEYVGLSDKTPVLSPSNTDFELMSSVFGAVGNLVSSNQLLSIIPGDHIIFKKKAAEQ